jgi:hypothetical protein
MVKFLLTNNNLRAKVNVTYYLTMIVSAMALTLLFSSCKNERADKARYYSIDSLVKAQITFLPKVKATVTKESFFNRKSVVKTFTPQDTTAWSRELDVFRQLNEINKPINRGNYKVEDGLFDPQSNLKVKLFIGKPEQQVLWLKIYYQNSITRLKKMEAQFNQDNALYKSSRLLTMEFQELNNKTVLTSYSVIGGQKMYTADSVEYSVKGKIKIY